MHGVVEQFLSSQSNVRVETSIKSPDAKRVFDSLLELAAELRYGL